MQRLRLKELKELLRWAKKQKDKKGRSLLERARESLTTGSYLKYNTTIEISQREFLEDGTPILYWDCNCPASNHGKHKNKPCKHVIARIILTHEKELRKYSSKWDAWFSELADKQIEEALETFSAFASL